MTQSDYSKNIVIAEALRAILVGDNTNTTKEVREIHFYVADRIFRGHQPSADQDYPQITYEVRNGEHSIELPTAEFTVEIFAFAKYTDDLPLTKLDNLSARITTLLNPDSLNAATSKRLRCRTINIVDISIGHIDVAELHRLTITFALRCDAEDVNV